MGSYSILNNIMRNAVNPFLNASSTISLQQTRNTFILKRKHPVPLHKKNGHPARFKKRHYIYDLVEDVNMKKMPPLQIMLTQYVDGVGNKGDIISQSQIQAYNHFLLPGLAVYVTPENIEKYGQKKDDNDTERKSHSLDRTVNVLSRCLLGVIMSADNPWTLEKWHIRSSFRKIGVYLNEESITMPERPISGPNMDIENKEFYVTVTVNKNSDVKVRCRIHHVSNDPNKFIPIVQDFFAKPSEPIYPEDESVLNSMPLPFLIEQAIKQAPTTDR